MGNPLRIITPFEKLLDKLLSVDFKNRNGLGWDSRKFLNSNVNSLVSLAVISAAFWLVMEFTPWDKRKVEGSILTTYTNDIGITLNASATPAVVFTDTLGLPAMLSPTFAESFNIPKSAQKLPSSNTLVVAAAAA